MNGTIGELQNQLSISQQDGASLLVTRSVCFLHETRSHVWVTNADLKIEMLTYKMNDMITQNS